MDDPINAIENSDMSEVHACRHCKDLIIPGKEIEWNGWMWCAYCVPMHVLAGREEEARANEAQNK